MSRRVWMAVLASGTVAREGVAGGEV